MSKKSRARSKKVCRILGETLVLFYRESSLRPTISSTMQNTRMIGRRIPTTKSVRKPSVTVPQVPAKPVPAVPIAIYRELSADLHATQVNITALQQENLQLASQNHELRQELEHLASQTQQVLQRFRAIPTGMADEALMLDELGFDADAVATRSQVLDQLYRALPDAAPAPARQFASQSHRPPLRSVATAGDGELNGWKLTLVMGLIVLSAFGAGFLVVRPLLAPAPNR
jgi:hypothetical protein